MHNLNVDCIYLVLLSGRGSRAKCNHLEARRLFGARNCVMGDPFVKECAKRISARSIWPSVPTPPPPPSNKRRDDV